MKDSTVRINDVVAFLLTCNALTLTERQHAHQLAANFIAARFPPGNAGQVPYEAFSKFMGLGHHLGSDPGDLRLRKRATYLLSKAIEWQDPAAVGSLPNLDPNQIGSGVAAALFLVWLRKAAIVYEAANGGSHSSQQALFSLYNFPLDFLRSNKMIVLGSSVRDATQGDQNALLFHFYYEAARDRYTFVTHALPGSCNVFVDSICAVPWTLVAGSWVAGNAAAGDFSQTQGIELASQFMITTQFTGCAFPMKRHNGHVYCAHLGPKRDPLHMAAPLLTGTQLAQRVATNLGVAGDFQNAAGGGPLSVYGAGFSSNTLAAGYPNGLGGGTGHMTIVGVQRGTDYEIYSQITQNNAIQSAQRIF